MLSKKLAIVIGFIVFIVSALGSYSVFSHSRIGSFVSPLSNYKPPHLGSNEPSSDPGEPKTEECPINGEMLGKSLREKWETRRPLAVMIENHVEARPQSGLSAADVIYEAVAEGGITRFGAIFYCKDAPLVGPVRSARVHFMKMIRGYGQNPLYAHVGGANCDEETGSGCANGAKADALGLINKLGWGGYNDMNQFSVPFPIFYRDPDRLPGVATEHTVYSSTAKLWEYAKTKRNLTNVDEDGVKWDKTFNKWQFKDDAELSERGTVSKISLGFWDSLASDFSVDWTYDKQTNSYKRANGGKPHLDKNTGKPITAKNVIAIFADEAPANDGYPGGHIIYDLVGSGDALIFQDGKAIKGTWNKKDEDTREVYKDANGKEISVVRGQVFIHILPTGNKVTYQ
jgi:hypothetical protein